MARTPGIKETKPRKIDPNNKPGAGTASIKKHLNAKKEDISRIVGESYQYFNRRKPQNNEEIAERLNAYFTQCTETGQIPTVEDMCLALGITRQIAWEWEHEGARANPERCYLIKKAKEILAGIDAKLVSEGKIPQVTYIFRAKNFFGMKDQQEVVLTPNNPLGDAEDPKALEQKYLENTYGISGELPDKAEKAEILKIAESAESTIDK